MRERLDRFNLVSIHAPREGCDGLRARRARRIYVSIHAPREGCDLDILDVALVLSVSIHAPREGCDLRRAYEDGLIEKFQFTHPVRGATKQTQTTL